MSQIGRELEIPEIAQNDPNSFELLRVWVANKGQHVSIRMGVWNDPFIWGMMLCDLLCHVANDYEQREGRDFEATRQRIKEGFDAEFDSPTDRPVGQSD